MFRIYETLSKYYKLPKYKGAIKSVTIPLVILVALTGFTAGYYVAFSVGWDLGVRVGEANVILKPLNLKHNGKPVK